MKNKLMLLSIPLIVLIICGLGVLFLMDSAPNNDLYVKQIELAEKYLSANDTDNAIVCFKKAIDADKTKEAPYLSLAQIYLEKNDLKSVIDILQKGVDNTKSDKLKKALAYYIDLGDNADTSTDQMQNQKGKNDMINHSILNTFSTYTYEKYYSNYAIKSEKYENDKYVVKYQNIAATFYYFDTNSHKCIDQSTKKPNKGASPNEIILDKIYDLIPEEKSPDYNYIKSLGAINLNKTFSKEINSYVLSFVLDNCTITVACDENGVVDYKNGYNKIVPAELLSGENDVAVSGEVTDKESGKVIDKAGINIRSGKSNENGSVLKHCDAAGGKYSIKLAPGDYTFEVYADNYNTEFMDVSIKDGKTFEQNFELKRADAAIVITVTPTSSSKSKYADIHCVVVSGKGAMGYVGHSEVYDNKQLLYNGQLVADYEEKIDSQVIKIYDIDCFVDFHLHGSYQGNDFNINVEINGEQSKEFVAPTSPIDFLSPYDFMTAFEIDEGRIINIDKMVKIK